MALKPKQGNWSSFQADFRYTELFDIPAVTSMSLYLLRDFWGTLFSSVKQIKAPDLFVWEQGIALHAMQGNRASSLGEG